MAEKILVTLKIGDGAEEVAPYIEEVAKPGTKVVFLIQFPVTDLWDFVGLAQDPMTAFEYGDLEQATLAMHALGQAHTAEEEVRLAWQRILPVCEELRTKGVEVDVDLYEDSLKEAIERHDRNGGVQLIMTRPGIGLRFTNFLKEAAGLFGSRKRPSFAPVLLSHPHP
jgi:hypothetical protein